MAEKSRLELALERKQKADELVRKIKAAEGAKSRKLDTREKIICGVMFQGLIADGAISQEGFDKYVGKYLNERDRLLIFGSFQKFLSKGQGEKVAGSEDESVAGNDGSGVDVISQEPYRSPPKPGSEHFR
jgi:hypothetical protein